ncbi:MAG: hydantoinase B/oxoprolinase family protein, partial [Halieaceae bacterium]
VLNDDLSVNEKRTEKLRAKLSKARGKPPLFDRGGTIDELKARCFKETGLQPPRQPEFQSWATAGLDLKPKKAKATKRKTAKKKSTAKRKSKAA